MINHKGTNMIDFPEMPDFLRRTGSATPILRRSRRRERIPVIPKPRKRRYPFELPKTMEPAAWALLREEMKRRADVKKARLAALKERR